MGIRRYKVLYDDSAAGTSDWLALDSRYEDDGVGRVVTVTLAAGDTFELQGIVKDVKGINKTFLTTLSTSEIHSIKTYTASENDILEGQWTYIRVVKTGTAGEGRFEGFV